MRVLILCLIAGLGLTACGIKDDPVPISATES